MAINIPTYPDAKHANEFERGLVFQDFVMEQLNKQYGWVIQLHSSRAYQFRKGESIQGFEIKLDERCTETGRMSIEIAERSNKNVPIWTDSGIMRADNTIFYIQGNTQMFWLFLVKHLRYYLSNRKPEIIDKFGTIRTFYLPIEKADQIGVKIICNQFQLIRS